MQTSLRRFSLALALALSLATLLLPAEALAAGVEAKAAGFWKGRSAPAGSSPYYLYLEKGSHTLTVLGKDSMGSYTRVVRQFCVATGTTPGRTPVGKHVITRKERWHRFYGCWAQYASHFGGVMVHSALYATQSVNNMMPYSYNEIGSDASGGCLRSQARTAYFVYKNVPVGTTIEVVNGSPLGTRAARPSRLSVRTDPTDHLAGAQDDSSTAATALNLSASDFELVPLTTRQLTANVSPQKATGSFKWSSSAPGVVSVDSKGKVTGRTAGTATITVKFGSVSASVDITVKPIMISGISAKLQQAPLGTKTKLEYKVQPAGASGSLTFTSRDASIASVSGGSVIGRKTGETYLDAVNSAGVRVGGIRVRVVELKKVAFAKQSVSLKKGSTYKPQPKCYPAAATERLKWQSSNAGIAEVSASGTVKGKAKGRVTITALRARDGKAVGSYTVTVK